MSLYGRPRGGARLSRSGETNRPPIVILSVSEGSRRPSRDVSLTTKPYAS
ncbi:MAG: hypothetical protein ACXWPS_15950 [Ktedonobacteraceae bacterium]